MINRLPDEVLRQIFHHLRSFDVDQKFPIIQVCTKWREIILQDRAHWNQMTLTTELDCYRHPLVLQRSRAADFFIRLLWDGSSYNTVSANEAQCRMICTQLSSRRNYYIRQLHIALSRKHAPAAQHLVGRREYFPSLEELSIETSSFTHLREMMCLELPYVKRLSLIRVSCHGIRW
jgi:hypothetical protein